MKHDLAPMQTIASKQVQLPRALGHEQFNWDYDSEGIILIVIRGMKKSYLIASVGPLSWRSRGTRRI